MPISYLEGGSGGDGSQDVNNNAVTTNNLTAAKAVIKTTIDKKLVVAANSASTPLDLSAAGVFKVTIGASTAFVFSNCPNTGGDVFTFGIITKNDGVGGRSVSFPANVHWAGGIIPPRTTGANAEDVWSFYTEDNGTTYVGSLSIADDH